jgi:hypothetical protein
VLRLRVLARLLQDGVKGEVNGTVITTQLLLTIKLVS